MQTIDKLKSTKKGKKISKKVWTGIGIFILIMVIGSSSDSQKTPDNTNQVTEEVQVEDVIPTEIEQIEIIVENMIVKKIDKKYRYFFRITNNDTKDFSGEVHITAKTGSGTKVVSEYIDFSKLPLKVGLSRVVNTDANSGPKHIAGEYGASTFSFSATIGKDEVATGEGLITDKFEDLSE